MTIALIIVIMAIVFFVSMTAVAVSFAHPYRSGPWDIVGQVGAVGVILSCLAALVVVGIHVFG